MVVLNRIYTRTGDDGTTALGSGERRPKYDLRVAAYGTVDETNATIGIARLHLRGEREVDAHARPHPERSVRSRRRSGVPDKPDAKRERLRISDGQVTRLEAEIDGLNAELRPLHSFVLPGGETAAAHLHLARTVCRRAERLIVELAAVKGETVGAPAIRYINRLSDLLFVAARYVNGRGQRDVLWVPGENR